MLKESKGCVFDDEGLRLSHGYADLDRVGQEAFVNHFHISGPRRKEEADKRILGWISEMRASWPKEKFRIYRQTEKNEVSIRFHMVRQGEPNWCESGIEIIEIGAEQPVPADAC